jgi:hypothetical protein
MKTGEKIPLHPPEAVKRLASSIRPSLWAGTMLIGETGFFHTFPFKKGEILSPLFCKEGIGESLQKMKKGVLWIS